MPTPRHSRLPSRPHAVFRCDASASVGAGHVSRCLTLADSLAINGWQCTFVCATGSRQAVRALGTAPHDVIEHPAPQPDDLIAAAPNGVDMVVIDHYGWDAKQETPLRGWAERILVIDDLADRPHDCDVLLDQSPGRRSTDYDGLVPAHAQRMIGSAYALIRPSFARARQPYSTSAHHGPILVSPGATDPHNISATILQGLQGTRHPVSIVLSSAAPHLNTVRALLPTLTYHARLHCDVDDMATFQAGAHLAIGAPGVSALERCVLGLPSLLIVTAENQWANARSLHEAGAAHLLGTAETVTAEAVRTAITNLEPSALQRMATAALQLCDGHGVARVSTALTGDWHDRIGRTVSLRPVVTADGALLLEWQRAPETRRFAHSSRIPEPAEHYAWLARQLAHPYSLTNMILVDGQPAGIIRLDAMEDTPYSSRLISILIAPHEQGKGIARQALLQATRLLPQAPLIAEVRAGNIASHRLFAACGFEAEGPFRYSLPPRRPLTGHAE